jgi:glycine/D-amino acid oxidase-like deaminating enzyme
MTHLVVIGEGVAASAFLFALTRSPLVDKFTAITQLASETLAPATSWRSTAIAALRGTQRGLSPLGDEICEMWDHTRPLFERENWPGLTPVEIHSWVFSDKAHRRYSHLAKTSHPHFATKLPARYVATETGWIVNTQELLKNIPAPKLTKRSTLVTALRREEDKWCLTLQGNEELTADVVVYAGGIWQRWFKEFLVGSPLEELKPVQGSFYRWEKAPLGTKSFVLAVEGAVCSYEASRQELLFGSTSLMGEETLIPDLPALAGLKNEFLKRLEFSFPDTEAQIVTGIRSQTKGRRPWAGELQRGLYAIGGLYKTGWVTAWPLGEALVKSLRANG